jgi:cation transport ATPase
MFVKALQQRDRSAVAFVGEGNENLGAIAQANLSVCVRGIDTSEVMI